jgi:hypothetical protein
LNHTALDDCRIREIDLWFRDQGVGEPEAYARMLAPGFCR